METTSLIGRLVGRYHILELIRSGSTASVFKAEDSRGNAVALKLLPVSASDARDRVAREAVWLSSCRDAHIARVYATGFDGGVHYIAMELLDHTMQELTGGRPSVEHLVDIGQGILLGLAAAHRLDVIHGDLKPSNVGIGSDGVIKLLDFGAANPQPWHAQLPDTAPPPMLGCVGHLQYLSPEHLRGEVVDERADIYGAAAVLYAVATGHGPFQELRPACLIDAILNTMPPPPSAFNGHLTPAFDAVLLKALAKRPSARFRTAHSMMDALLEARISSGPAQRTLDESKRQDRSPRFRIDPTVISARAVGG